MQCPKCGSEIPEGKLYCPKCGYAVQIVPDYDADLEENLGSVGTDIAGNVNRIDVAEGNRIEYDADSTTREVPMVKKDEASDIKKKTLRAKEQKERIATVAVAGVFVILVGVVAILVSRSFGRGSFVPQTAMDEAISADPAYSASVNDPMSAAVDVDMGDEMIRASLSEDSVPEDSTGDTGEITAELVITPEEGRHTKPHSISAKISYGGDDQESTDFEGIIYYTDDGSEPDEESKVFKHDIPMPVGHSTYAFRFLDKLGNLSGTWQVEYDLQYEGGCSPVDASNVIVATLIQDGALLDIFGHVPGSSGVYTYRSVSMISSGSRDYYLIPESYEEPGSAKHETGTIYAVDAVTLETFKVKQDSGGNFSFEMFY